MTDYEKGIEADYWDDDPDAEFLKHKTLADAVQFYVEQECGSPTKDDTQRFLECLRVLPRRTFFAWKRATVDWPRVESIAIDLAEQTLNNGLEEMLDPSGLRSCDRLLQKRLTVTFGKVLRDELMNGQWRPWTCNQIGEVTLPALRIEEMMREINPHWFEVR